MLPFWRVISQENPLAMVDLGNEEAAGCGG